MFSEFMALSAKRNEIGKLIGTPIVFAESAKWNDVMNVKFSARFLFANATVLAAIAIALSRFASLRIPVRAVVIVAVSNMEYMIVSTIPSVIAIGGAKLSMALRVRNHKGLLALLALPGESSFGLRLSHTFRRTESLHFICSIPAPKRLVAMFAISLYRAIAPLRTLLGGIGASLRAVFAVPAILVLKLFVAVFASEGFEGHKKCLLLAVDRVLVEGIRTLTRGTANNNSLHAPGQQMYALDAYIIHQAGVIT